MITQTAISAQSFGTGGNTGQGKFSIAPLTFNAGTLQYAVSVLITNGAGIVDQSQEVRVWYATTQETLTGAQAVLRLKGTARYVDLRPNYDTAGNAIRNSVIEPVLGQSFHCWVDAPALPVAATITVKLLELTTGLTAVVPGTSATSLGKAEDAVAASGDTGVFMLGVRQDAAAIPASATGDYSQLSLSKYGAPLITPLGHTAKTFRGVANVTAAALATDIAILPGNATNTVQLLRVIISAIETTAGLVDVLLIKRSTANTGGTSTGITAVPLDAADAAAVSAPLQYTANPTPGTAVGTIARGYLQAAPLATGVSGAPLVFDFGQYGKPVILSGVAQGIAVNLNGVTVTGGIFSITFEWLELP